MADKKISELGALDAATRAATDVLPIVDVSAGETKKITVTELFNDPLFYASGSQAMRLTSTGLGIGTSSPVANLHVSGSGASFRLSNTAATTNGDAAFTIRAAVPGVGYNNINNIAWEHRFSTGTSETERMRIDSSGNLIQTVNTTAATLTTNQTLTFSIVDNSTLRISVRGSDGTTRTATIALS